MLSLHQIVLIYFSCDGATFYFFLFLTWWFHITYLIKKIQKSIDSLAINRVFIWTLFESFHSPTKTIFTIIFHIYFSFFFVLAAFIHRYKQTKQKLIMRALSFFHPPLWPIIGRRAMSCFVCLSCEKYTQEIIFSFVSVNRI